MLRQERRARLFGPTRACLVAPTDHRRFPRATRSSPVPHSPRCRAHSHCPQLRFLGATYARVTGPSRVTASKRLSRCAGSSARHTPWHSSALRVQLHPLPRSDSARSALLHSHRWALFIRLAPAEPAGGSTDPWTWMPSGTQDGLRSRGCLTTRRSAAAPPWGPPRPPPRLRRRQDEGQRSGPHLVRMEHDDSGLDGERATAATPVSDPHQHDTPVVTNHLGVCLVHLGLAPGDNNPRSGTTTTEPDRSPTSLPRVPSDRRPMNATWRSGTTTTGPDRSPTSWAWTFQPTSVPRGSVSLMGPRSPTRLEPSRCSHTVKRAGVTRRRPPGGTPTVMIWWSTPRVPVTGPEGSVDTGCTRSDSCCSTHLLTAGDRLRGWSRPGCPRP